MGLREGLTDDDIAGVQRGEATTPSTARCWPRRRTSRHLRTVGCDWAALGERFDKRSGWTSFSPSVLRSPVAMALKTFGVELDRRGNESGVSSKKAGCQAVGPENLAGNSAPAPVDYDDFDRPEQLDSSSSRPIFKKTWLNVGRVERCPKKGSYFTREMPSAGQPDVGDHRQGHRTRDVRAFYNMCRHRGKQAGCGTTIQARRVGRHVPSVHLQVPRLALLADG
jgi:hypothetical protein